MRDAGRDAEMARGTEMEPSGVGRAIAPIGLWSIAGGFRRASGPGNY